MGSLGVLYNFDKNDKKRCWEISVDTSEKETVITTRTGHIGGKITEFTKILSQGKNIGRANSTTHFEQGLLEAKAKHKKKIEQGFSLEKNRRNVRIKLPMLAMDFKKRSHDIVYPCFVQPKLDGIRCIYRDGKLMSRTGKVFPHMTHILEQIQKQGTDLILDGELYNDNMSFQDISSVIGKVNEKPDNIKDINYIIFDHMSSDDYIKRLKDLEDMENLECRNIKIINTEICDNEASVKKLHGKYTKQGYEGIMIRNFLGKYDVNKRSKNLQKFKKFMDDEYKISGFTRGTGKEKDAVIWTCITPSGIEFNVRPKGTIKERENVLKEAEKYIGEMITVKFFNLTDDGVPRFPTTLHGVTSSIRNYE